MNIVSDIIDCVHNDLLVLQWMYHDVNNPRNIGKEALSRVQNI